jgi:hypothetical protein
MRPQRRHKGEEQALLVGRDVGVHGRRLTTEYTENTEAEQGLAIKNTRNSKTSRREQAGAMATAGYSFLSFNVSPTTMRRWPR